MNPGVSSFFCGWRGVGPSIATNRVSVFHSTAERTADWPVLPPDPTRIDRYPQSKDTRGSARPTGQIHPGQKTGDVHMCPPHGARRFVRIYRTRCVCAVLEARTRPRWAPSLLFVRRVRVSLYHGPATMLLVCSGGRPGRYAVLRWLRGLCFLPLDLRVRLRCVASVSFVLGSSTLSHRVQV